MKINIHTHQSSGRSDVLELVNQYPHEFNGENEAYFSIGIHPWYIEENRLDNDLRMMEEKLTWANCLAVGECGIDKRINTDIQLQKDIFIRQLFLAEKYKKPVVLHCVAAYQEMIAIKKEYKVSVPMIVHGFSKNSMTAESLLKNGFYLSFGKYLLRNPELSEVFKTIPEDAFFLETDTIEETIDEVYKKASDSKGFDVEDRVKATFNKVFNLNK